MGLRESLEAGRFVVTVEIDPPKGTDISHMTEMAEKLVGLVDAANVTDNQLSVMRLSPLASAYVVKQCGIEPVMQLTCRDRNRLALQSDLLAASVLGIRNVLALTGDFTTQGDHPDAKPVFDLDSVQLVSVIKRLNSGQDLVGNQLKGNTDFLIGVAANPGAEPAALHLMKLNKKIAAGANFIQTQAVYDVGAFKGFLEKVDPEVKVLAGVVPLRSFKMANFMHNNIPGMSIPKPILARMEGAAKPAEEGMNIAVELIERLRGVSAGVHIMAVGMQRHLPTILERAGFVQERAAGRLR